MENISVLNAEAYVLFYRKQTDKIEPVRSEVHRLLEEAQTHPSLLQFFVSRQWFNKLENCAEPGKKFIAAATLPRCHFVILTRRSGLIVPLNSS